MSDAAMDRAKQINDLLRDATGTAIDQVTAETRVPSKDSRLYGAKSVWQEAARQMQHETKRLRGDGASWDDVADELLLDDKDDPRGVRAFELVESLSLVRNTTPSVYWRCAACGAHVEDFGPYDADPGNTERGHMPDCPR